MSLTSFSLHAYGIASPAAVSAKNNNSFRLRFANEMERKKRAFEWTFDLNAFPVYISPLSLSLRDLPPALRHREWPAGSIPWSDQSRS